MNIKILIVLCLILVFGNNISAQEQKFDLRNVNWGMSSKQVIASESIKYEDIIENKDSNSKILIYSVRLLDKNFSLGYIFINDQLIRAKYFLKEEHTNKNDFIIDYNSTKEALSTKYGKPDKENTYWKNDLYKNDYSDWGLAISIGHLAFFSSWKINDMNIFLFLRGDNYKISCGIEYDSDKFKDTVDKIETKQDLEKL